MTIALKAGSRVEWDAGWGMGLRPELGVGAGGGGWGGVARGDNYTFLGGGPRHGKQWAATPASQPKKQQQQH
jgi:hypothetical protein